MATSTLAALAPQVQDRLQDPLGIFWNEQFEINAALAEGISELLLIVGRPTQIFNESVILQPNTVWQPMIPGLLCITDIRGTSSRLQKTTLRALDYTCSSWTSSWESDRAAFPIHWAPLGLNYFIVHPAPILPIPVNVTGIAYPFTDTWPPASTDTSPFAKNVDQALQLYAAAYCRVKTVGQDAEEGFAIYQQFLEIAQRLSAIEDRRDSLVWSRSLGAPTAPSQVSHR
jgi:hypothetical protein